MRLLFEALPILAAMFALVLSCRRPLITQCPHVRLSACIGALSAVLLIVAQTSWSWSVSVGHNVGEDIANVIWTVFNLTVMLGICYAATKGSK